MLVVWCSDWPVVAAGAPPDRPAAVVHANRVVACSAAARAEGVRPSLRRREAQGRCPELELLAHDPARDARAFEPVLVAVERLTPWVQVPQPARLGLACTRLRIEARTDRGETLSRVWRYDPTPTIRPSGPDPVPRSASSGVRRLGPAEGPGRLQRPGPAGALGR